ncbi:extracellular solute-binding protein [Alphaproteobacteria bacterium]|nr:extracellular solute-binding protein [Alphaproteobacteria bacterium]
MITLKGMTWDHPRGYDPMIATSKEFNFKNSGEVFINWDKRSLQAFADKPIEEMTSEYDLIVIDYPHVGEVAAKNLLAQFDIPIYEEKLNKLMLQSVGKSFDSYKVDDHQWALPIDSATQVSAYRQDLISFLPKNWNDLIDLAKQEKVLWPLKPVHSISSFYSIYNNIGETFNPSNKNFVVKDQCIETLKMMKIIADLLPRRCFNMDPIDTAESMSENNHIAYCPYLYGFSNYSRQDFRKNILFYSNVLDLSGKGPVGTHLGGTGIAVSTQSKNKKYAMDYAYWIASADCQKKTYYENGGQPGNAVAWEDEKINLETNNFFNNTRQTLEEAWVRPKHNGYMIFQDEGGDIINEYLQKSINEEKVYEKLKSEYKKSFKDE